MTSGRDASNVSQGRLKQQRVLVTRPKERATELCFLLEDEGAHVLSLPLLELVAPDNARPLAAAAEQIHRYGWVLFASPSAVEALVGACREAGTLHRLQESRLAVVGPRTAEVVKRHGLNVTFESPVSTGRGLAEALLTLVSPRVEVLLPAAQEGRPELAEALAQAGFLVTRVAAYKSVAAETVPEVLEPLQAEPPAAVLFASPRTVHAFFELDGTRATAILRASRAVAIGPTTARALEERGFSSVTVAERPTAEGLVEATVEALRQS